MAELTVPWEDGIEAAFERKKDKYAELASQCHQAGWRAYTFPVEVGCRGYTGSSTQRFLKTIGVNGPHLRKALKDMAEEAEQGSFLDLVTQERQSVGERWILGQLQGVVGRRPCHCSTTQGCSGIKERNICEGWLPADDPAVVQMALAEVRQAEMPSRAVDIQERLVGCQGRLAGGRKDCTRVEGPITLSTRLKAEAS
ncbi:hypothetical protein WMY93_015118 [Mugilogobius chulae]|uniref:Uncharacterized protein n=1 Tax=Mugilogobius chulae TaxID=88201 RepID=A0AAW0NXA1_9GOBI